MRGSVCIYPPLAFSIPDAWTFWEPQPTFTAGFIYPETIRRQQHQWLDTPATPHSDAKLQLMLATKTTWFIYLLISVPDNFF